MNYYVMCRLDYSPEEGEPGKYILATSRSFPSFKAAETYAEGIDPGREPKIVMEVLPLK